MDKELRLRNLRQKCNDIKAKCLLDLRSGNPYNEIQEAVQVMGVLISEIRTLEDDEKKQQGFT